jgi:hypothetical protein
MVSPVALLVITAVATAISLILHDCVQDLNEGESELDIAAALDPNDKEGVPGVGLSRWTGGNQAFLYSVDFLNEPSASAAAQQLVVTDILDPSVDLSTFGLDSIVLGGTNVPVPTAFAPALGQNQAGTSVDYRPAHNLLVNVNILLNSSSRTLSWQFTSIDPTTGLAPSDPTVGVLPPGVEGSVAYSAKPAPNLATGTTVLNQATIAFDTNPPMNTQTWINTIDNSAPISHVASLPTAESLTGFTVNWLGTDAGAGIQGFTIFASDNGAPFAPWLTNTTATSATFTGQLGHIYAFYSIARDLVGNVEASKTAAEATTQVALVTDTTPPVTTAVALPAPNGAGWNNANVTINLFY